MSASFWGVSGDATLLTSLSPSDKAILIPLVDSVTNNSDTLIAAAALLGITTEGTALGLAVTALGIVLDGLVSPVSWRSLDDTTDIPDGQVFATTFSQVYQLYSELLALTAAAAVGVVGIEPSTFPDTAYTALLADSGKTRKSTAVTAVAIELPNDLPVGWAAMYVQGAAGQITLSAGAGAALHQAQGNTKTWGLYSPVLVWVDENADDVSAVYLATGDLTS